MSEASTMRAMMLTGYGGPDKLEYRNDVPIPSRGADDVLIRVSACGMNNTDINTRTGWYAKSVTGATGAEETQAGTDGSWGGGLDFPRIQGADPVGNIVAVGPNVPSARIGERVLIDAWMRDPGSKRLGIWGPSVTVASLSTWRFRRPMPIRSSPT